MPKRVSETAAGKWFLDEENDNKFKTGSIPKKVLFSLSKLTDEEISQLAEETCWDAYWSRFHEHLFTMIKNATEDEITIGEDEFSNYMKNHQQKFFPSFEDEEEMVHEVALKLRAIFDTLIFWAEGLIHINEHFDLFEASEQRAMIDASASFVRRTRIEGLLTKKMNKIVDLEQYKERSYRSLIKEALKNKDAEEVKRLIRKYNTIQERMG